MTDYKDRIKNAIHTFEKKNNPNLKKKRKSRNTSPESDYLRDYIDPWLKKNGFSMDRIESKATYNPDAKKYLNSPTTYGMSDRVGCDRYGRACYIEAKAPNRTMYLRLDQKEFLLNKLNYNAFCCVVNDVDELQRIYDHFLTLSLSKGISFLTKELDKVKIRNPKITVVDDDDLWK